MVGRLQGKARPVARHTAARHRPLPPPCGVPDQGRLDVQGRPQSAERRRVVPRVEVSGARFQPGSYEPVERREGYRGGVRGGRTGVTLQAGDAGHFGEVPVWLVSIPAPVGILERRCDRAEHRDGRRAQPLRTRRVARPSHVLPYRPGHRRIPKRSLRSLRASELSASVRGRLDHAGQSRQVPGGSQIEPKVPGPRSGERFLAGHAPWL